MPKQKKIEPLVGEELITKVRELETLSKDEKAKECGYYTVTKNGVERVNNQFHQIGLELLGFANARSDVEAIAIAWDLLADLG
ncbi:MAG: hypothetical protein ACKPE1_16015, partial [Dolichospermum sp.]